MTLKVIKNIFRGDYGQGYVKTENEMAQTIEGDLEKRIIKKRYWSR